MGAYTRTYILVYYITHAVLYIHKIILKYYSKIIKLNLFLFFQDNLSATLLVIQYRNIAFYHHRVNLV